MDKIKIKISEKAHDELFNLLSDTEYNCVRIKYLGSCCSGPKVDLVFDNLSKNEDNIDNVDKLNFIYNEELSKNIKEITIIYKANKFHIKIEGVETEAKACKSGCNSDCTNCTK